MAGALEQLRKAVIDGEPIEVDETSVIIGSATRLNRSQPTTFHSMRGRGDAYLLESLFFQFKFRDQQYNDYVQACRKEGVAHVTALDKRDLLAYLTGDIETCANIVSKEADTSKLTSGPGTTTAVTLASKDNLKENADKVNSTSLISAEKDLSSFTSQRKRDRDQRALDSVLMVAEWDFSILREKLAKHVSGVRSGRHTPSTNGSKPKTSTAYDPRGDRYTSNEDRFWRENLGSEFHELGIDMGGSFKQKPTAGAPNSTQSDTPSRSHREKPSSRKSSMEPKAKRTKVDPKELIPIVIVPAGSTALIYSGNIVDFLQNGRFVSADELAKNKAGQRTSSGRMSVFRTPGGNCSRAEYQIVSNPNRLVRTEWERVVAVVCSGQEWQFKNWPLNERGVADLFRKVQGFYFQYDDAASVGNVDSWAIKKLGLSRGKRHTDGQVQVQFWSHLDAFMRRKGKQLRY